MKARIVTVPTYVNIEVSCGDVNSVALTERTLDTMMTKMGTRAKKLNFSRVDFGTLLRWILTANTIGEYIVNGRNANDTLEVVAPLHVRLADTEFVLVPVIDVDKAIRAQKAFK